MIHTKRGAAALSIASNAILIALKLAAGAITGSIAIITEAVHSLIDLVASVVAYVSVRKADEPADEDHPYGHEKVESLAANIEGMLILVGATTLIAGIASTVTLSSMIDRTIQNAEELRGRKVASLPGSTAAEFIQMSGGVVVPVGSIAEATEQLKEAQVDAMVYDRPQLAYFVRSHPEMPFVLSSAEYDRQGYGFAFPLGFPQLHEANVALLELEEDGFVDRISSRWLGRKK